MEKNECLKTKISSRMMGLIILPFALMVAFFGALIIPLFGLFFAVPLFALSTMFLLAPESKACRILLGKK